MYKALSSFPKEELYGLTSQIKRCAVSISSNIAEGFSRASRKEKRKFYLIASGSLSELKAQLLLARDLGFLEKEKFDNLAEKTIEVSKLLGKLIKSVSESKK